MVLWLSSKVLEDALLPESLHEVPVFNNAMADGVLCGIARDIGLITNIKVYGERKREREREREKTRTINTLLSYGIHILTLSVIRFQYYIFIRLSILKEIFLT